jgi:hypothetical protein
MEKKVTYLAGWSVEKLYCTNTKVSCSVTALGCKLASIEGSENRVSFFIQMASLELTVNINWRFI